MCPGRVVTKIVPSHLRWGGGRLNRIFGLRKRRWDFRLDFGFRRFVNITDPYYPVLYDFFEFGCHEINADMLAFGHLKLFLHLHMRLQWEYSDICFVMRKLYEVLFRNHLRRISLVLFGEKKEILNKIQWPERYHLIHIGAVGGWIVPCFIFQARTLRSKMFWKDRFHFNSVPSLLARMSRNWVLL